MFKKRDNFLFVIYIVVMILYVFVAERMLTFHYIHIHKLSLYGIGKERQQTVNHQLSYASPKSCSGRLFGASGLANQKLHLPKLILMQGLT